MIISGLKPNEIKQTINFLNPDGLYNTIIQRFRIFGGFVHHGTFIKMMFP